jgi:circadian clock protein KaiC
MAVVVPKIKTYVEGFDEELGGGIPENHVVLAAGTPGTMKSSILYSILYNNGKEEGRKGLYVSIEESKKSLLRGMANLGMDDIEEDLLLIVDLGTYRTRTYAGTHTDDETKMDWLNVVLKSIERRVKEEGRKLVAFDSLSALYSLCDFEDARRELFHFFTELKKMDATIFLISEMEQGNPNYSVYDEDFLSDGIICLQLKAMGDVDTQLRIKIVKMRHTRHKRRELELGVVSGRGKLAVVPIVGE